MAQPACVQYSFDNGIITLTLNRPSKRNALDIPLITELTQLLTTEGKEAKARVIVINAEGSDFCAGADLNWMKQASEWNADAQVNALVQLLKTIDHVSKPIIALVQGRAFAGSLGLLSCCDLVIATPHAQFCFSEVKLGLIPATIAPYVIRRVGYSAARRYFITAELFSATEAQKIGLIHHIVDEEHLWSTGYSFAKSLMKNGPQALMAVKQLFNELYPIDPRALEHTAHLLARIRSSQEAQEGIHAFLDKRSPDWNPDQS